ncbi:MAG: signal peptidase II [Helicobacteraceae bacterium]|nr:signal peptidase II [Helicobacteraceae bacterium]
MLDSTFWVKFGGIFTLVFAFDQIIKWYFVLKGYAPGDVIYDTPIISLLFVYNTGVAFSMFAFLQGWLKYLQIVLLCGIFFYLLKNKELLRAHCVGISLIFGAGVSNILDRFLHIGVVDYIFWHYKFEFAIFNFADVMINVGVFLILLQVFLSRNKTKKT